MVRAEIIELDNLLNKEIEACSSLEKHILKRKKALLIMT